MQNHISLRQKIILSDDRISSNDPPTPSDTQYTDSKISDNGTSNCTRLQPYILLKNVVLIDWIDTISQFVKDIILLNRPEAVIVSDKYYDESIQYILDHPVLKISDDTKNMYNGIYITNSEIVDESIINSYKIIKPDFNKQYKLKLLCNWTSFQGISNTWNKLNPNNGIVLTDKDPDYYSITNYPLKNDHYEKSKTIVSQMEPCRINEEGNWGTKTWGEWYKPDRNSFLQIRRHEHYMNNLEWHISKTYDELTKYKVEKTKNNVSIVVSDKLIDKGHKYRVELVRYIQSKNKELIDVYGMCAPLKLHNYRGALAPGNKDKAIFPYKYIIAFENNDEYNYFSEKLTDGIMGECLVFYWGCPNIKNYVHPESIYVLDPTDHESNYNTISEAINNNEWEKRLPYIRETKKRLLYNKNLFATIHRTLHVYESNLVFNYIRTVYIIDDIEEPTMDYLIKLEVKVVKIGNTSDIHSKIYQLALQNNGFPYMVLSSDIRLDREFIGKANLGLEKIIENDIQYDILSYKGSVDGLSENIEGIYNTTTLDELPIYIVKNELTNPTNIRSDKITNSNILISLYQPNMVEKQYTKEERTLKDNIGLFNIEDIYIYYNDHKSRIHDHTVLRTLIDNIDMSKQYYRYFFLNELYIMGDHSEYVLDKLGIESYYNGKYGLCVRANYEYINKYKHDQRILNNANYAIDRMTKEQPDYKILCVNLERRPDRKQKFIHEMEKAGIDNYHFYNAIDGSKMKKTNQYILDLFEGNDIGWNIGALGCALSHLNIWYQLLDDKDNETYIVFEDDMEVTNDFKTKLHTVLINLNKTCYNWDICHLGHHVWKTIQNKDKGLYDKESEPIIKMLNKGGTMGGTYSYIINKSGAKKMCDYIAKKGIKHGIDYIIMRINDNRLVQYELYPHIVFSEFVGGGDNVDSDIQKGYKSLV